MQDIVRAFAENFVGHSIPDRHWTPEARTCWKVYMHGYAYGMDVPIARVEVGAENPAGLDFRPARPSLFGGRKTRPVLGLQTREEHTVTSNIMHNVPSSRRREIVKRHNDGVSKIIAAELKDEAELAFAIRWLMDHFTYKRSKGVGVNTAAVQKAATGVTAAMDSYVDEVAEPRGIAVVFYTTEGVEDFQKVSGLGDGVVANPYGYL